MGALSFGGRAAGCAGVVLLLGLGGVERPAWGIGAVCNPNGGPLERAQCTIDSAGQTGAGNPQTWQPTQVPGYVTDSPPETGYFDTSGNPQALDQSAAQASTSPQANDLRDKYQQAAGYDLTNSPPVETARQVAQQPPVDPGLSHTCQTTTTCVSWQQTPVGGGSCQTPGTQQEMCFVVETPTATSLAYTETGSWFTYATAGNQIAWCVTAQWYSNPPRVAISVAFTNCPATYWMTTFQPSPPAITGTSMNLQESIAVTISPNCSGAWTWVLSPAAPYGQAGTVCGGGYVGLSFAWTYRRSGYAITTTITDGCAWLVQLAQQNQATLQSTQCLEAGDKTVTATDGAQVVVPISYSTRGCWREQQTWLRTSDTPDTCQPYREQGCAQTSSVCGQQDSAGNCMYYNNTYQCMGQTCAAEQTVRMCATCGDPNGLVPFCLDDATPPDQSLAKTAAWLQVLQNAKDQWDPNTLTIFRGDRVQCTHGTGFGNMAIDNCCADPPNGGSCTQMDWDAYAARREKRAHYVGEYCSNWVNLLLGRICVEQTIVWCAFPTSFARIIHDQGRPALPRGWGTPQSPDCGPFTIQEFQRLPFDQMDFSEVYDQLLITNDQQGLAANAQQAASQATGR